MAVHGKNQTSHRSSHKGEKGPALIRTGKNSGVLVIPVKKKPKKKRSR